MNEQKRKPVGILLTVILIAALLIVCLELGLGYLRPDIPGSIPKHLIHFGIMFALLGGAVLLFLFCPPFKKLWAWIDEHILSQETRPIAIDIIYAVFAGLMLLHHFYVILYYPTLPTGATKFAPIWLILAAVTVLLGKSWRNISFRLAAIFFLFSFERLYLEKLAVTGETAVYFFSAIYALFICLGAFSALRLSVRKPFLQTLCALWALATLALSIAGLYTAWTGINIPNLAGAMTAVRSGRLRIFAYPTISAAFTGCGGIMTLVGFAITKQRPAKILYLLAFFVIMIANALTDARAAFIILAFVLAGVLCVGLWTVYRNQENAKSSGKKTALVISGLIFCFGICFYGAVEGQRFMGIHFVEIRNSDQALIPTARAEEPTTEKTIFEATIKYDTIATGGQQVFTVKTTKDLQYLMLYGKNGIDLVETWYSDGNSVISDKIRIWTVARAIQNPGNRELIIKAGTTEPIPVSNSVTVPFTVETSGIISSICAYDPIVIGAIEEISIKTTLDIQTVNAYSESGDLLASWNASNSSKISGSSRSWNANYKVNQPGEQTLLFRGATESGETKATQSIHFTVITTENAASMVLSEQPIFKQRDIWLSEDTDPNKTFSNRLVLWQRAAEYIQQNPRTLLFGLTADGSQITEVVKDTHAHNLLVQTLLEGGLPALLLFLALVLYGTFHAFRLWNRRGIPFWQRLLPLPIYTVLLWEMAECVSHFSFGHPPMTLLWFFLGATITVGKSLGKAPKTAEQPTIPAESAVTETGE